MGGIIMAFLDGIGKKISSTSQSVVKKAKGLADITGLKSQINEEEKRIHLYYQNLGQQYYELNKEEPQPELGQLVQMISQSFNKINDLEENIKRIENMKSCPACGEAVDEEAAFCVGCGIRLSSIQPQLKEAEEEKKKQCIGCGAEIPFGSVFCIKCGKQQA